MKHSITWEELFDLISDYESDVEVTNNPAKIAPIEGDSPIRLKEIEWLDNSLIYD